MSANCFVIASNGSKRPASTIENSKAEVGLMLKLALPSSLIPSAAAIVNCTTASVSRYQGLSLGLRGRRYLIGDVLVRGNHGLGRTLYLASRSSKMARTRQIEASDSTQSVTPLPSARSLLTAILVKNAYTLQRPVLRNSEPGALRQTWPASRSDSLGIPTSIRVDSDGWSRATNAQRLND
ncbi:hypothetical protein PM082_007572 [Marasmius tenuissimus]|nr:hypothetical protein PM082_007572 [Marasmius tenuissimus]